MHRQAAPQQSRDRRRDTAALAVDWPVDQPDLARCRGVQEQQQERKPVCGRSASGARFHTLLVQQVLAELAWASRLSDEDRRGLTALFWSNVNPYGTFRLDMNKRLDLGLTMARPRTPADAADRSSTKTR
ncbi:hypothetical protein ACFRR7_36980 [Streptomyces sp. NPDC056909]|uniref:hypothetical protein n=1 Tax=Streptomyces sp. NPDC056909 TaxID=3345963 RepID=UPI0036CBA07B